MADWQIHDFHSCIRSFSEDVGVCYFLQVKRVLIQEASASLQTLLSSKLPVYLCLILQICMVYICFELTRPLASWPGLALCCTH